MNAATDAHRRHRVLVADDHAVVRLGVTVLLSGQPDIEVIGEATDGQAAVDLARKLAPDVVVMDIRMPGLDGISACREIRAACPRTEVVMLTSFGDEASLVAAVQAGAKGYVLKDLDEARLVEAIRAVARGGMVLDPSLAPSVMSALRGPTAREQAADESLPALDAQERRILALIARGLTNREIGERLHFSEKTIRNHVSEILAKIGLRNRAEAAAFAVRHRLDVES